MSCRKTYIWFQWLFCERPHHGIPPNITDRAFRTSTAVASAGSGALFDLGILFPSQANRSLQAVLPFMTGIISNMDGMRVFCYVTVSQTVAMFVLWLFFPSSPHVRVLNPA
jgi:hypothetical protein